MPWLVALRGASVGLGGASGLVVGTVSGAISSAWIPGGLAQLGAAEPQASLGAVLVAFIVTGIPWAVIGAAGALSARQRCHVSVAVVATAVFGVETARSYLPGALPWLLLGHSQWEIPGVAQLAALGGVPLISALLAALNAALAASFVERRAGLRLSAALLGAYVLLAGLGLPVCQWLRSGTATGAASELLVVQPNIPVSERWIASVQRTNLAIAARQTEKTLRESPLRPDLVVWPETLLTSPVDTDALLRADLEATVDRLGVPVILGAARSAGQGGAELYRNSVLWLEPGRGLVADFDKTQAIPVVESAAAFPGYRVIESLLGLAVNRSELSRPLRSARCAARESSRWRSASSRYSQGSWRRAARPRRSRSSTSRTTAGSWRRRRACSSSPSLPSVRSSSGSRSCAWRTGGSPLSSTLTAASWSSSPSGRAEHCARELPARLPPP